MKDVNVHFKYTNIVPTKWQTRPTQVEGYLLTEDNIDAVAQWAGGQVKTTSKPSDPSDTSKDLLIPTLAGALTSHIGEYVVKDLETGRLTVLTAHDFEAQGFYEVGLRQDGIQKRGGSVSTIPKTPEYPPYTINSGEAYGEYVDPRHYYERNIRDVLDMS